MNIEILYQPSYSIARVNLVGNEGVVAESGAMVGMSAGMSLETKMRGGLLKSLARSILGGESLFTNTYRAPAGGGEVIFAPALPGDMFTLDLAAGESYLAQSGCYLASAESVEVDTHWGGAKTFFASEGLIMLRCSGIGALVLSSYGAIHEFKLAAGQHYTVDTGHLVAFSENIGFAVRRVGGMKSTLLSGEGLVVDLTGPGRVLLQTRSQDAFLSWLIPHIPKQSSSSGS